MPSNARQGQSAFTRRRGFTLPEILIAGGLALLLMGVLIQSLIPAMRYSAEGAVRVELQQAGILALQRMTSDLQKTTAAGVSLKTGPVDAMAVNTIQTVDSGGVRVWSDEINVYSYDPTRKRIEVETQKVTTPTTAFPNILTSVQIQSIASSQSGRERLLALNVDEFVISPAASATTTLSAQPLSITLKMGKDLPHTPKRATMELVRSVFLRNS